MKEIIQANLNGIATILKAEGEVIGMYRRGISTTTDYKYKGTIYRVEYFNSIVQGVIIIC